jgi:hypothetical protein
MLLEHRKILRFAFGIIIMCTDYISFGSSVSEFIYDLVVLLSCTKIISSFEQF